MNTADDIRYGDFCSLDIRSEVRADAARAKKAGDGRQWSWAKPRAEPGHRGPRSIKQILAHHQELRAMKKGGAR